MFEKLPATPDDFYQDIIGESLTAIKVNTFYDNFDAQRFNYDGVDRSMEWMAHERVVYFDWFYKNAVNLANAYSLLEDDKSKSLYLHIIAYRLASHFSVKLPVDFLDEKSIAEYQNIEVSTESELEFTGAFGKLKHFDFVYDNKRYLVDCLGLSYYLQRKQYFYDRDGVSIKPEADDVVIDGGACLGDSAAVFSNAVGENGKVYAFDPVKDHLDILQYNISQFPLKNVVAMPYGLSNENIDAEPITLNGYAPGFSPNNITVPLRTIDSLVDSGEIEKVDFIKLDVEGYEMDVLLGAAQSIQKFQPKLAISLYHKPNDIFELTTYIRDTYPFYHLHIGHYTIHNEETVLYCAP
ncbi:MAG: FkbM family methyltransferase [Candidatus Thiodiazotropha taylori]|nr:FkbM family methyltransferase [Candidatus Thiodiazotropha taylori]MCW4328411.1 FkbM family methyltransferase [Candidatus Thiodiazotropha taylori]